MGYWSSGVPSRFLAPFYARSRRDADAHTYHRSAAASRSIDPLAIARTGASLSARASLFDPALLEVRSLGVREYENSYDSTGSKSAAFCSRAHPARVALALRSRRASSRYGASAAALTGAWCSSGTTATRSSGEGDGAPPKEAAGGNPARASPTTLRARSTTSITLRARGGRAAGGPSRPIRKATSGRPARTPIRICRAGSPATPSARAAGSAA